MLTTNLVECFVLEPFSSLGRLVLAGLIEVGVDLTLHSMLSVEFGFTTIAKFQLILVTYLDQTKYGNLLSDDSEMKFFRRHSEETEPYS